MTWQEYQEIIGDMYESAVGLGKIRKNFTIPDKITGQARQIDAWIDADIKGHFIGILIDAKFHANKIDVKDVEEVLSLAQAVGADKCVLVCSNGWTEPAGKKAIFSRLDLRLVTVEDAVEFLNIDKWIMCPVCEKDCIIMDSDGYTENRGLLLWWLAGRCRECRSAIAWCQDCGVDLVIPCNQTLTCGCGHHWRTDNHGMFLILDEREEEFTISRPVT